MTIDYNLKLAFRRVFPEYSLKLENCNSQSELTKVHKEIIKEARYNLAVALKKDISELSAADETAPMILTEEEYQDLIDAKNDVVKNKLLTMVDGVSRLKGMKDEDPIKVTLQLVISGALSIGKMSTDKASKEIAVGVASTLAAYAGVSFASVAVTCAIATLTIVSVIIPIIYFMTKPANCLVLLINELDEKIIFDEDYNVHGKPMLMTSPLEKSIDFMGKKFVVAGFIATEKKESALFGTQYGFTMKYKQRKLSFGVECPLTSLSTDNNCYCAIDDSAEQAAHKSSQHNKQFWESSKEGISMSIRCNSGSGSIAYYVARVFKRNSTNSLGLETNTISKKDIDPQPFITIFNNTPQNITINGRVIAPQEEANIDMFLAPQFIQFGPEQYRHDEGEFRFFARYIAQHDNEDEPVLWFANEGEHVVY